MADICSRHYDIHGVFTAVTANRAALLEAIERRLRHFAISAAGPCALRLDYRVVPDTRHHVVERPQGPSRQLIAMPIGGSSFEAMYSEHDDVLYLSLGDTIRALVDARRGSTVVSAVDGHEAETWLLSHPFLSLPLFEGLRRHRLYPMHAAAVSVHGKGLLLAGISGAGKSTLALALARAGLGYLGDDTVLLDARSGDVTAFAFPDELDISPRTAAFFPELEHLARTRPQAGHPKHGLFVDELYGVEVVRRCTPKFLVMPAIADVPASVLRDADAEDVFIDLVGNVLLTHGPTAQRHLDTIAALLRQVRCYRLQTGGDLEAAAEQLRTLIERGDSRCGVSA
jgi:hypothetical protein